MSGFVEAGPAWPEDRPATWPTGWVVLDREAPQAEPEEERTWPCGFGGRLRCPRRLPARGLCEEHRAALARVKAELDGRQEAPARRPIAPFVVRQGPTAADRLADAVAETVARAASWPVKRSEVARAVGVGTSSAKLTRAIADAEASGRVRVERGGAGSTRGLYGVN